MGRRSERAARAAADVCLHDQKACNASHVQYVEGTDDEVAAYAEALRKALRAWDSVVPPVGRDGLADELTALRRGRLALADWYPSSDINGEDVGVGHGASAAAHAWSSGVVVTKAAFDVLAHPFARFVVIRPVSCLDDDAVPALSRHVASAGVWPEDRRLALRTAIAARGVSSVLPLGRAEHTAPGAPHDGMLALQQLVDWARSSGGTTARACLVRNSTEEFWDNDALPLEPYALSLGNSTRCPWDPGAGRHCIFLALEDSGCTADLGQCPRRY